ncbi:hypothetical protein AgCh_009143 [Apium graveolens]
MDVKSAFLNGDLEEEFYVSQPPGFEDPNFTGYVYYYLKALYGLKQAPRAWYDTLSKFLLENHFTRDEKLCKKFAKLMQSKLQVDPRESHLVTIKRIFRYLKGTPKLGIWYPRDSGFDITGYSDADYAVSTSTAEAEYIVADSCCVQILWMKNQLLDYGLQVERIPIFYDNISAIAINENSVQHSRTKHIDIKYHFIREHVMNGTLELHFVPSEKQLADIFTKPLDESTFSRLVSELAPVVKIMSQTGFIYVKNNFTALVNKGIKQSSDYHKMMDFVKNCKLNYAMLESPTIICEVVEDRCSNAVYNSTDKTITLTIKGKELCINSDVVKTCFKIPDNTVTSPHTDTDIVNMFNSLKYALPTSKLSEIRRLGLRKEWSYLCDVVTKVFSGKISNFDSVNISMLNMLYMLVTDKYFNFSNLVLFELGFKLGELNKRGKNVYYARFFMMLANHLSEEIVLGNPTNKLDCWVQERRIIADLNRANNHREVTLFYFPVMEAPQCAMATVSMTQQLPTQATKPSKFFKSKSKKAPSGISQKMPVAKSTKSKEGSVKVGKVGEGQGEHKRNTKDKVGEVSVSQPSHTAVSQQTAVLNKEISSLLVASSQQVVTIEQSSHPRARAKRVRDTISPQTYTRKKKSKTLGDAHGSHTVQTGAKDTVTAPSQSQLDVAAINMESQPKYLLIKAPQTPNSPTNSLDVDMINTSIPDSPSLTVLGKPKSSASEHHLLDDLLAHLPILSGTVETSMPKFSSICTESIIVSTPNSFIPTLLMDIVHPSSSDCIPMDKLNSSYPSDNQTANPTDIPHPSSVSAQLQISSIISSAEDLVVVQSLIGLREEGVMSESLGYTQEKGEENTENMQSSSSGLAKESVWSPTLDGEGTGAIRVDVIASELMNVQDADREGLSQQPQAVIESTSLDAKTFTHPVPAYQLLAEQGNDNVEMMLNLVHTTQSMLRAMPRESHMDDAIDAMKDFWFEEKLIKSTVYDGSDAWNLIEDGNYATLLDLLVKMNEGKEGGNEASTSKNVEGASQLDQPEQIMVYIFEFAEIFIFDMLN